MLAIGTGAQNSILDRINAMGTDLVLIRPSMPGFRGSGSVATLVPEDADAILQLPNVKTAVPEVTGSVTLRRGNVDYQSQANGTVAAFTEAKSWKVATGDFITAHDMEAYAPVAVLGTTVVKTLFPDGSNPIGQYILIQKIPFQVIGTLETKGAGFGGSDQDDVVIVPLSTGNLRLFGQKYVRTITVQVKDADLIDTTQDQIQELLDQRHKQRDTMITNMSSIRDDAAAMGSTMTLFLGSVAAISLLVGGIGVMNIMLVSVTERTREIGVRMATGARRRDILLNSSQKRSPSRPLAALSVLFLASARQQLYRGLVCLSASVQVLCCSPSPVPLQRGLCLVFYRHAKPQASSSGSPLVGIDATRRQHKQKSRSGIRSAFCLMENARLT